MLFTPRDTHRRKCDTQIIGDDFQATDGLGNAIVEESIGEFLLTFTQLAVLSEAGTWRIAVDVFSCEDSAAQR